jgi:hypothetical protein
MTNEARTLRPVELAAEIRKALKAAFPHTTFRVRKSEYAGGSSVYVSYEDGPCLALVEAITDTFQRRTFDGQTDSTGNKGAFQLASGEWVNAYSFGTRGWNWRTVHASHRPGNSCLSR